MKIVVYGPEMRVGVLDGTRVIDVAGAYAKYARETQDEPLPYALASAMAPSNLQDFIDAGPRAIENAQKALDHLGSGSAGQMGLKGEVLVFETSWVRLHAPLPSRGARIMMAAANYADHAHAIQARRQGREGLTVEDVYNAARGRGPGGFWKHTRHVVASGDDVLYPTTQRFDYEGEVTVVLGRAGQAISAADAPSYIWGYTLQNDWSRRDYQESTTGSLSLSLAKNFDTSSTIGPCIVVGERIDPRDVSFETKVNGVVRQSGNTKGMTFSFAEYVEWLSKDMTLQSGDMIAAGTCAGTALDSGDEFFLKVGDVVEVSAPLIGSITNRIVARP